MARKRKLNKRVAVLLAVIGGVMVLGMAAYFFPRLTTRNSAALLADANSALREGRINDARKFFGQAINRAPLSRDPRGKAEILLKLAEIDFDLSKSATVYTDRRDLYMSAIAQTQKSLQLDDSLVAAHRLLCDLQWGVYQRDFMDAAEALLKVDPNNHLTWYRRALTEVAMRSDASMDKNKLTRDAMRDFQKAISIDNKQPEYYIAYERFLVELDDSKLPKPLEVLTEGLKNDSKSGMLHVEYAAVLARDDQKAAKSYILGEALAKCPDEPAILVQAARYYLVDKDEAKAKELIAKARKIDPAQLEACLLEVSDARRNNDLPLTEKIIRGGLDETEKAARVQGISQLRKQQLDQSKLVLTTQLITTLMERAQGRKQADQRKPAFQEIRELVKKTYPPGSLEEAKFLGMVQMLELLDLPVADRLARLKEATELLAKASQGANGRDPQVLQMLVQAYLLSGEKGQAEALVDNYLREPGLFTGRALFYKGQFYRSRGELQNAKECFTNALKYNPDDAEAQSELTAINVAMGEQIAPGAKIDARTSRALMNNVQWEITQGNMPGAVKLLKTLRASDPGDISLGVQLMQLYVTAGQPEEARKLAAEMEQSAKPEERQRIAQYASVLTETDPQKQYDMSIAYYDNDPKLPAFDKAFLKAGLAAQAGKADQCAKFLDEAGKLKPEEGRVVLAKFQLAVAQQKWPEAQSLVEQAARLNADLADGKFIAAQLAMAQGQYDQAAQLIERDVMPKRSDNAVRMMLAQAYQSQGRPGKAIEVCYSIIKSDPTNLPAIRALIMLNESPATATEQERWIREGYKLQPNDPVVSEAYQSLMDRHRKPEDVLKDRMDRYSKNPDNVDNILRIAALYERTSQPQEAQKWYEKFMEKMPNKLLGASRLAGFYIRSKQQSLLAPLLEKLLAEPNADKVAVYVLWGDVAAAMNDVEQAKTQYSKAINVNAKDIRGYLSLATLCSSVADWPNACKNMQEVIALQPARLYLPEGRSLVNMLVNNKDQAGALKVLDQMLARNAGDFEALQMKAAIMRLQDKDEEAAKLLNDAVDRNKTAPEPLVARGLFYAGSIKMRDLKKAEDDLQAASKLSDRPDIALDLAGFYQRQLDYDGAVTLLERTLLDHKDYEPAMGALVNLYAAQRNWTKLEQMLDGYKQQAADPLRILLLQDQMYRTRQDKARRLAVLEEARKLQPDSEMVLQRYLLALAEEKEYDLMLKNLPQRGVPGREWVDVLRARGLVGLRNLQEGDAAFGALVGSASPNLLNTVLEQARSCYEPKDFRQRLQQWAQQRPQSWEIQYYLGSSALEVGDFGPAETCFKKAVELAAGPGEKSRMLMALGMMYARMYEVDHSRKDQLTQCTKILNDVLKLNPNNAIVLNNLAYIYIEDADNLQEGYAKAKQAYDLAPNPQVLDTLAWAIAKMAGGRQDAQEKSRMYADAQHKLELAVRLDPGAATCYHLGWVYEKTGQPAEAQKLYRQAKATLDKDASNPLLPAINDAIKRLGA